MSDTERHGGRSVDGAAPSEPVTVVVTRAVRDGRHDEYEAELTRLLDAVGGQFDGYLGTDVHRPTGGSGTYTSVFRFDSLEHLRAFEQSDLRRDFLRRVAPLVAEDAVWERHTGLEMWFEPPPGTVVAQPSRFRMAVLLVAVVYLLVLGLGSLATALLGDLLAFPVRLLVVIAVEVALMTYVLMPWLTRRLAHWIYPARTTAGAAA